MNQSIRTTQAWCPASTKGVMAADQTMGPVPPVGDMAFADSTTLIVSASSETQHNYYDAMASDSDIDIDFDDFLVHQDAPKLNNAHYFYPPYSVCCMTLLPLYLHILHPPHLILQHWMCAISSTSMTIDCTTPASTNCCTNLGATEHILNENTSFHSYHPCTNQHVILGNDTKLPILSTGTAIFWLNWRIILVCNILHVPGLRKSLYVNFTPYNITTWCASVVTIHSSILAHTYCSLVLR